MSVRRLAGLLILLAALGCGGGSSSSGPSHVSTSAVPAATPPPAPSFRDGWTEQNVVADIVPAAPSVGVETTVRSAGYLTREARFDGSPFYLWPQPEEYVRQLVYTDTNNGNLLRLARYEASSLVITPESEELQNDAAIIDALWEVAAEASRAIGIPVSVGPNGVITVHVDANQPRFEANTAVAFAQNRYRGWTIISSRLIFSEAKWISGSGRKTCDNTALHEMGHALGLHHSADPRDVMNPCSTRQNQERIFSEQEYVALKMMYRWRKPANATPDRDPTVAGAVAGPSVRVIVD